MISSPVYNTSGHTGFQRAPYESAATDPTADWDEVDTANLGQSFEKWDTVFNVTNNKLFTCPDSAATAAVWKSATLA